MISLTRISKQIGKQILFVDASFQLNPGETVGLVGSNGSGKTTLFRLITGEETPDDGEISIAKMLTVGYFRQDVEESSGRAIVWLERFLKSRSGSLLMTSHDREFMNRIVDAIAEIDDGEITDVFGQLRLLRARA